MKENILFSKKLAQKLNDQATTIDSRLFVIGNYSPAEEFDTAEAGFILACLNLYKCTVDGMPIWKNLLKYPLVQNLDNRQRQIILKINAQQEFLRSIYAHNNCVENGDPQASRLYSFETWVNSITKGVGLSSDAGCQLALEAILDIGEELFLVMTSLLDKINTLTDSQKSTVVNAIIKSNAEWVCKPSHMEIYWSRLERHILATTTIDPNNKQALQDAQHTLLENCYKDRKNKYFQDKCKERIALGVDELKSYTGATDIEKIKAQIIADVQQSVNKLRAECVAYYQEIDKKSLKALVNDWISLLSNELVACVDSIEDISPHAWVDYHVSKNFTGLSIEHVEFHG